MTLIEFPFILLQLSNELPFIYKFFLCVSATMSECGNIIEIENLLKLNRILKSKAYTRALDKKKLNKEYKKKDN